MTAKQKIFINEYLLSMNATQSAIKAGYSARSAYSTGQRLLNKAEIKGAIDTAMNERLDRLNITIDKVLTELAEIAFQELNSSNVFAKLKALELLGKHLGMFTDKVKTETPTKIEFSWASEDKD